MTEAEWWAATDPRIHAVWVLNKHSPTARKCQLLAHACACRLGQELPGWPQARLLGVAEQFIEGEIDLAAVREHLSPMEAYRMGFRQPGEHYFMAHPPLRLGAATGFLSDCWCWAEIHSDRTFRLECFTGGFLFASATGENVFALARGDDPSDPSLLRGFPPLFHDIFGPLPFRDVPIAPEWLTSDVTALARGIYEDKAFDRMPVLADALQDAGCDNEEVLAHCRGDGPHVRGCWVVDLLLGRPWREAT